MDMMDGALAWVLASAGILITIGIVFCVLTVIAWWKLFAKAGEPGWKSLIPIYNVYTLFKISWTTKWYWLFLLFVVASGVLSGIGSQMDNGVVLVTISSIVTLLACLVAIVQNFKMAKVYGHGFGFGLGLFFFNTLFIYILAFGSSRYVGAGAKAVE